MSARQALSTFPACIVFLLFRERSDHWAKIMQGTGRRGSMAADRFDLAEGIVKLVGNATDFQNTLDDLEKEVQDHETKVTSITWKAAQIRAEKIKQVAERSNREVRRFQEQGLYGNRTALLLEQQRFRA